MLLRLRLGGPAQNSPWPVKSAKNTQHSDAALQLKACRNNFLKSKGDKSAARWSSKGTGMSPFDPSETLENSSKHDDLDTSTSRVKVALELAISRRRDQWGLWPQ